MTNVLVTGSNGQLGSEIRDLVDASMHSQAGALERDKAILEIVASFSSFPTSSLGMHSQAGARERDGENVEIFHYSNEGVLSWYDFAKEIMRMAKLDCQINPIETKEYPTPAQRPHYSLLNKSKIKKEFGIIVPYWKDSLDECLRIMGERR